MKAEVQTVAGSGTPCTRGTVFWPCLALVPVLAMAATAPGPAPPAAPRSIDRQFDIHITLTGMQSWRNDPQATEATTTQDYDLGARLRSNGFLYSDDLLDRDQKARLEIKQQYYARQGLLRLKAENGGKLPARAEDVPQITERYRQDTLCKDDFECNSQAVERLAAVNALGSNTTKELEEFLDSPGGGDEPRYLYFFGFAGCPTRIHMVYAVRVDGKRAYDHDHRKPVPYSLERHADTAGSDLDRKTLCEKFIATMDTKTGLVELETLYLPSPRGTSVRTINGSVEKLEQDLPPPMELIDWSNAKLRQNKEAGTEKLTLPLNAPLDGDRTVQGTFTGKLDVAMTWSFKTVPAPPLAPPATR